MTRLSLVLARDLKTAGAAGLLLLVLLASVLTNRYRFEMLPLAPHAEHFAIVIATIGLAFLFFRHRARFSFQKSDALLAAYLMLALVSSVLFPPQPRDSVTFWARMILSIAVFFLARWLLNGDVARFRLILIALLVFGTIEAVFGIVSWFLYPLGINLGVDQYPLGIRGPGGVLCNFSLTMYGTLWEPNIFASTLMTIVLVGATLFVSDSFLSWRKYLGGALALMLIALGLNSSRAAFLTLAGGLVLVILLVRGMSFKQKTVWSVAAALLILLAATPSQQLATVLMQLPSAPGYAKRERCAAWFAAGMPRGTQAGDPAIDPSTGPESDLGVVNRALEGQTLVSRFVSYRRAWDDFLKRPILGNGANSFGQKYTTTAHTPEWISNMILMSLHDTGIVGTVILLAWFAWFALYKVRALYRAPPSSTRTMVLGLGIGLVALFIAYQVTTMLWFGLIWYLMAAFETGSASVAERATG